MPDLIEERVATDSTPGRLDRWLADQSGAPSRAQIQSLIRHGHVHVNGIAVTHPSASLKPGDRVRLALPPEMPLAVLPEPVPLMVMYEDDDVIVVDKPAGMVVHPGAGNPSGTLVNALLHHCGDHLAQVADPLRPGIVHRIDKETSGLLVAAKSNRAYAGLTRQFAEHSVGRVYIAFVHGHPAAASGKVDAPIGRHPVDRKRMAVTDGGGKHAITHYDTETTYWTDKGAPLAARILCRLETGRTHQVRVHLASVDHPLLGDPVYGRALPGHLRHQAAYGSIAAFPRQALHAATLAFRHPSTGKILKFSSEMPYDLQNLQTALNDHNPVTAVP